jgi:hypothetical protein
MKRIFTLLLLAISCGSIAQVRISQAYGGGGNASATYNQDFVELFNAGASTVSIGGWSVQYSSAAGTAWSVAAIPGGATIASGKYYLVALATGATGIALPAPDATVTTVNMSGTTGKVALVNVLTALSGAAACSNASVVDVLGFGAGSCFETAVFPTTGITTAQSILRKNNGCTDNNNNSTDFILGAVTPRNSSAAANVCTSPSIIASPGIINLTTTLGNASQSQSFNLSASNLTPSNGNLIIDLYPNLEMSFDNITFSAASSQPLAYTAGTISTTPIYIRIAPTAPQGLLSPSPLVIIREGGAISDTVTVNASVAKNFYSQPTGNLSALATWGDVANGTGTAPTDFTSAYQIFNVTNRATAVPAAHWEVSGTGSKIVIGDGINPTTLTTTSADSIKSTTVIDILNNGTLEMGSRVAPTFGNLATGSTVNYNFNGTAATDTVRVNAATYHNLILKDGLKFLKSGITTVNGNLVYDATVNSNGAPSPFSTISLKGDLSMINNAIMEDSTTGFGNRLTLSMAGATAQTINTGTSELRIFRLQRDTTVLSDVDITLSANSKVCLGNPSSGGLSLLQKVAGTPTTTKLILASNAQVAIVKNGFVFTDPTKAGIISATDGKIIINKSVTSTTYPGTLKFDNYSSLSELTINITTPAKDSVTITNNDVVTDDAALKITGTLNLTKGVLIVAPLQRLKIDNAIIGGSVASYIDGKMSKGIDGTTITSFVFPLGKAKQYSPVQISTTTGNFYTVQYTKHAYPNLTINPTTTTATPGYNVSTKEYWDIEQGDPGVGTPSIKFYYNSNSLADPTQTRIAHFNGIDWDDIGRDANGTDAVGNYILKNNISGFSPFTFGGAPGVLPIILQSFNGSLQNNISTLQWKTNCENAGDAFELQYSADGRNFTTIYKTDAMGNCNGNMYKFLHTNVTASLNYYRLLLKSMDGQYKTSNIVMLRNGKINFEFSVLPSFDKDQIGYAISSKDNGKASIAITNSQGQTIYKQNISYTQGYQINYLNMNTLTKGMYLMTIRTENNGTTTVKFVK